MDTNTSLWSSWYIRVFKSTTTSAADEPDLRAFFAGDTGLRYRDPTQTQATWETCPVFAGAFILTQVFGPTI